MADKRFSIVFDAKMEIGSIKSALDEINKLTSNASLNLPKGISSGLTKTISGIRSELLKLEGLQGVEPNAKNASAITKSYESIFTKFQSLQALMKDLGNDIKIDPNKLFPAETLNNIKQATAALDEYHKKLKEGPQDAAYKKNVADLGKEQRTKETALGRQSAAALAKQEAEELAKTYRTVAEEKEKLSKDARAKSTKADSDLKNIEKEIQKRQDLLKLKEKEQALETQRGIAAKTKEGTKERLKQDAKTASMEAEINSLKEYAQQVRASGESLDQLKAKAQEAKTAAANAAADAAAKEKEYQAALKDQQGAERDITKYETAYKVAGAAAEEAAKKVEQLNQAIRGAEQTHQTNALETAKKAIEGLAGISLPASVTNVSQLQDALSNLNADAITKIEQAFEQAGVKAKDLGIDLEKLKGKTGGFNNIAQEATAAQRNMDMLKSRLEYFFSALNIINLFKRTVREAINTVKELDAVMTETAVVTEFDIGDMWNKLPQYAAQANQLGASIKDMYAATTLYYQQGLQTEAAMGVGVETMKMARIAGMEAADATTAMTAALRGFNMEVNEMNAQRVNDVYSELAAITAADTNQIATAMGKTASIAASANMEFETTSALLAQIIETTQEAPETAGTAMKTIIARFTEVKELFSEGMLTGEDEEGEEININKIDAALKSVGISLKDFLNGSKGIDDIFLELASKWDTLDLATQRYIATMAAGSRQQSRFIAMMSNYERTMELVGAANNSTGASQKQFDKTLESMEAKLQNLNNAWNQFIMGLANSDLLKAGVDALTGLLNAINGIISGLSGESGGTKTIMSLLTVIGALKGGSLLAGSLFGKNGQSGISLGYGQGFKISLGGKSAVDQVVGANSQQRAQQLGRQHGLIYVKSFKQAVGTGGGFGGFFGTTTYLGDKKLPNRQQLWNEHNYKKFQISTQKGITDDQRKKLHLEEDKRFNELTRFKAFTPDFSHISMGAMAAGSAITLLSKAFKDAGPQGQAFGRVLEKIGTTMTGIGSIGMMLGPTLNNLGMTFSKSGVVLKNVIVGAEAAAEGVEAVGDAAKTTGKTLEAVGDGAEAVGDGAVVAGGAMATGGKAAAASWAQVGAVLGWVALVLAVIAAVAVTAYYMHPETQLKQAKKAADNAEKGAQNAASAFQELNNSIDQLDEKKAKIDELTRGTKEWKQEVTALNDEVLKLVEQNPELASFVKNNNGILEFDKSGNITDSFGRTYEDIMAIEEAQVNAAKAAAYDAQRTVLKKQEAVEYLDYVKDELGQGIHVDRMQKAGIDGDFVKLTNSLARAISNGDLLDIKYGATEEDYLHNQEIFSDYIRNNFDYSEVQADMLAKELMKEASALQQFGNSLAQVDAQMSLYNDQLASTIVESAGIAEGTEQAQILENLDSSILANIYDSVYDQARSDALGDKTRKERREAYADLMGYEWAGGNKYNTENGQITVRPEEMRAALASQEATSQAGEKAAELAKDISTKTDSQKELIGALFNSDGSGMTRKVLSEWGAYNSETGQYELDLSKATKSDESKNANGQVDQTLWTSKIGEQWALEYVNSFTQDITEEEATKKMQQAEVANQVAVESGYANIKEMADAFDTSVDGAVEMIVDSLETGGDAFVDARKNVVKKMAKHTGKNQDQYLDLATQLQVYEKVFGEEIVQTMSNVFSSLEMSNNDELVAQGFAAFQRVLDTGDRTAVEEVSGFIQEVNWNSSIEALDALNYELEHGTEATKEYAANLKALEASYFDLGSLTQDLVGSEQFKEISNEIDEILASNEELNASDVKDLAKSYSVLNKYLENTEVTASGLAKALTMLQNGELAVHQLTDAVMGALSSMNSLDDLVADTVESLENFDYGVDENTVAEKTKEMAEILRANINKGAYGNSQNFEILDYMFGPDWDKDLSGEALENKMKELTKILESNSENFANAWKSLAEQGDVDSWLKVDYEDGEAFLTGLEGHTTDEIISEMTRAYGLTENMARMMLTDFKNYSSDIAVEIAKNDYAAGIEAAVEGLNVGLIGFQKTKFIDETELQAISQAAGKSSEEVWNDLVAQANAQGYILKATQFYDKDGILKEGKELFQELGETIGSDADGWMERYTIKNGRVLNEGLSNHLKSYQDAYDFSNLESDLAKQGFNESDTMKIGNEMLNEIFSTGQSTALIKVKGDNGELLEVIAEAGDTYEDVMAKADYTQTSNQLTDSIVAAFEQIETLDIAVNEEGLASLQATLDALQTGITVDDHGTIQGLATEMQDFIDNYNNQTITLNAAISPASFSASATAGGSGTVTISLSGVAAAKGLVNAPRDMDALTGENGPELVQTDGGYYIVGQNGPEMANIKKGDTVYTAEQTRKILKGSKHTLGPRYEPGKASAYGNTSSGGSGGRSTSDDEGYKTSIDKLYNLLRDIDEELRIREALERRYTKILEGLNTTAKALIDVSFQELEQLKKERSLNEERIAGRQQQIQQYQQENSKYNKYAWSETDEHGNMVLRVDWDAINAIDDEETGKGVEEYLGQLEDWFGDIEEAEDNIIDIDEAVKEINERGKDEYFDFENQVKEALIDQYQEEIDKLSDINDSINDTNSRLLDAVQKSIDQQRQARENAKTEEDLADKRAQLAYLQQDTSGANALDILRLQEEIAQGEEDYTDTLIDQKINELQQQNDEAAQQRERQIEIAQEQLDHWVKNGEVWNAVYGLLATGIDEDGIISGSDLGDLLKSSANFKGMSELEKVDWLETLEDTASQALHWLEVGNQLENLDMKGKKIDFTTADGTKLSGTIDKDGNITADGKTYKNIYRNYDGTYVTREEYEKIEPKEEEVQPSTPPATPTTTQTTTTKKKSSSSSNNKQPWYTYEKTQGAYIVTYQVYKDYSQKEISRRRISEMRGSGAEYFYASGGLADFTGPAWLDGTKSRPEYVLNADQTRAFFTLVDVLESLRIGTSKSSENSGDTNYDIDINVESIGNDYDVEQMASTIKRLINEDARYRNNNAVNLMR